MQKAFFYLTLAVIATTFISWFNINSCLIMLLVVCRLLHGKPGAACKAAFTNKYFLAYFSIFLLDVVGLLYTHHFFTGWKYVESKATLVAIPFILCGGTFTDKAGRARLLSAYCGLLFLVCLYCLVMAAWHYSRLRDPSVFFYHSLLSPFSANAVFFSAYVISALLFLLSSPLYFGEGFPGRWLSVSMLKNMNTGLVLFFTAMIVLLSSKLLLILTILVLARFLYSRLKSPAGGNSRSIVLPGLIVALIGMLVFTNNPVAGRYKEMTRGNFELYRQGKLPPFTVFNGVSLRLLIWRSAYEILNEQKAWVFGVSAGDGQDLLNKKYVSGINPGYLNYNFHNEYIEVGVRSGLVGLCIFLASCWLLIALAGSVGTAEAWFTIVMILLLCLTESMLEMQLPAFYCCFFPLLLLYDKGPDAIMIKSPGRIAMGATEPAG